MPLIHLNTHIQASIKKVFDLSRDIDLHQRSTVETKEKAIAGKTSGLIELGESVTWEAIHFGIKQKLTTKITAMNAPHSFTDEMQKGAFKSLKHEHLFSHEDGTTTMIDNFYFEAPFGIIGQLFNTLILKKYMTRYLEERNAMIKLEAESQ